MNCLLPVALVGQQFLLPANYLELEVHIVDQEHLHFRKGGLGNRLALVSCEGALAILVVFVVK